MAYLWPERRGFSRTEFSFFAVIKGKDDIAMGRIGNISLTGLNVRLGNKLRVEPLELIVVTIYLDGSEHPYPLLYFDARVVWVNKKGVGVQFRPMALGTHTRLMEVISFIGEENQTTRTFV